jgi:hypothetical protein
LRTDDGFEDREGHQAPFTLPKGENVQRSPSNAQRPTSNLQRSNAEVVARSALDVRRWAFGVGLRRKRKAPGGRDFAGSVLLEFLDRLDDGIEVRPLAGLKFGIKELSIGANFKGAAARGNERERLDAFAEFENLGRQTDGLWRVVSNQAVFDRHFGFHPGLLSEEKTIGRAKAGQERRLLCRQTAAGPTESGAAEVTTNDQEGVAYRLRVEAGASPPASGPPGPHR